MTVLEVKGNGSSIESFRRNSKQERVKIIRQFSMIIHPKILVAQR